MTAKLSIYSRSPVGIIPIELDPKTKKDAAWRKMLTEFENNDGVKPETEFRTFEAVDYTFDPTRVAARKKILRNVFGKTNKSPFLWSIESSLHGSDIPGIIGDLHRQFWSKNNHMHFAEPDECRLNFEPTITTLFWAAAIAYGLNVDFASSGIDERECERCRSENPLLHQLSYIEIPLWQLAVDPDKENENLQLVIRSMEKQIDDLLDRDGWPDSGIMRDLGLLTASWCRCHKLIVELGHKLTPDIDDQLRGLSLQLRRIMRADGSFMFGQPGTGINCNSFKKCVDRIWNESFLRQLNSRTIARRKSNRKPATSAISEWGQVGVIRQNWKDGSNKVGFVFGDKKVSMDIDNSASLIVGDCTPELIVNGKSQLVSSEIGVSGFLRFEHGEFIELEIEYGQITIHRQIMLLCDDELLYLNDIVSGPAKVDLRYRCEFPIGAGMEVVRETQNNELYLKNKGKYCLVLPLSMPEWKSERSTGKITTNEKCIAVEDSTSGRGLSSALLFDLNPKRSLEPRTWRRLTVAEQMKIVGPDIAAAFRVQLGRKQWLFYRTIVEPGNRTFLGQNFADDFFVGRIGLDGKVEQILSVE